MQAIYPTLQLLFLLLFSASASTLPNGISPSASSESTPSRPIYHRALGGHYLPGNWLLHYHAFTPFVPSWSTALHLSHFWSEIGTQVSNRAWTPDDQFLSNSFALHMPLGTGRNGQSWDLSFEVFNTAGPVRRELVLLVAGVMMEVALKGFCATFNARLRRGEEMLWIVLRVKEVGAGVGGGG